MRKEVFLAIFIGTILGLTIAGVSRYQNLKTKMAFLTSGQKTESLTTPLAEPTPTPQPEEKLKLIILEPENESLVNKSPVTIKGATAPKATVILIGEEDELILQADENGNFETGLELTGGVNEIEIAAYDEQNNETKQLLTITYSTAKF